MTHKLWGFPIFFALMWLMFWCTFSLGAYPQDWLDALVGWIGDGVNSLLPEGPLRDMLSDGVIGGVGAVIVFLPQIMILYLFISFLEDSGYLARAAFIMDRVMHRIGLHGKSFIPMIMGFGCNVPAIMACRTIESRSSRLITILITPFMSCSARLPIYILLTGTFFSAHAGLGDDGALRAGNPRGGGDGAPHAAVLLPRGRNAVRHGAAPLPDADVEDHAAAHVGQVRAIPAQDGRHDPHRLDRRLVPELLPARTHGRCGRERTTRTPIWDASGRPASRSSPRWD